MQLRVEEAEVVAAVVFRLQVPLDLLDRLERREMMVRLDIPERRVKMPHHQHHLPIHLSRVRNVNVHKMVIQAILDHRDRVDNLDSLDRQVLMDILDLQDRLALLDLRDSLEALENQVNLEHLELSAKAVQ